MMKRPPPAWGPREKRQLVDDLVTLQVLIQDAKRLGPDHEELFRSSIQNYYEQTLLKNLIRKKMSEIRVSAVYSHGEKVIYIAVDEAKSVVLAHETAHAAIQFFGVVGPLKIYGLLAQYVEENFEE